MIVVENKRCKEHTLLKRYGDCLICDVTSQAKDGLVRLSPFYPHGDIPVPFSEPLTATCVEAIWQGLKVFESADVDVSLFQNDTMKDMKRTVRRFGPPLGHRRGVHGAELLSYLDARREIYLPSYLWMLEHHCMNIIDRLREAEKDKTIVLLDYNTNPDPDDPSKPLSHAALVRAYALGVYPYGPKPLDTPSPSSPSPSSPSLSSPPTLF